LHSVGLALALALALAFKSEVKASGPLIRLV